MFSSSASFSEFSVCSDVCGSVSFAFPLSSDAFSVSESFSLIDSSFFRSSSAFSFTSSFSASFSCFSLLIFSCFILSFSSFNCLIFSATSVRPEMHSSHIVCKHGNSLDSLSTAARQHLHLRHRFNKSAILESCKLHILPATVQTVLEKLQYTLPQCRTGAKPNTPDPIASLVLQKVKVAEPPSLTPLSRDVKCLSWSACVEPARAFLRSPKLPAN